MSTDTDRLQRNAGLLRDSDPELGRYYVHPNRYLGIVVLDHEPDPTVRPDALLAVAVVDCGGEEVRALVDERDDYNDLADRLETAGVSVDRREAGEGDSCD